MGEEAKQDQAPAEETPVAEEKKTEEKEAEDKSKGEEKAEEPPPKPPSPLVLQVDLHCHGCAKKIERSILKLRGVEAVAMDMGQNQLTIKGVVEPVAVCAMIAKKTKRRARVLSPLPAVEGDPLPDVVMSQVTGLMTVELNVDMHCRACAAQLKSKIHKMRGVRTVETELSSGKVTVTGTMDATKVADYVYRRTKKQARIVPQPEPPPPEAPAPEPKPAQEQEESKLVQKEGGEDDHKPSDQEPNSINNEDASPEPGEKKDEPPPPPQEAAGANAEDKPPPPEAAEPEAKEDEATPEESSKSEESNRQQGESMPLNIANSIHNYYDVDVDFEDNAKVMMMYYYYPPRYAIERIPPPQLFSDENPNACCIA